MSAHPAAANAPEPLLGVHALRVRFGDDHAPRDAVDDARFEVFPGETVCLVGESGSGKTVTALSILRLEGQRGGRIVAGELTFDGTSLRKLAPRALEDLRGRRIAMIFQEPMTAFDPVFTIGDQIVETVLRHRAIGRAEARARAVSLLARVRMPDPALRMRQIPAELSGGMRQRAMIAMALACDPDLLIADEPTTALDVTIQAQILALLRSLQRENGMAILLITHDLGVAAQLADRVVVMYAGRIAEQADATRLFEAPAHPYTRGLLRAAVPADGTRGRPLPTIGGSIPRLDAQPSGCRFHPRCAQADARCRAETPRLAWSGDREVACFHAGAAEPTPHLDVHAPWAEHRPPAPAKVEEGALVEARTLSKHYDVRGGGWLGRPARVHALDGVSLALRSGETLGLVGESGCGKSTLGRVLLGLERPSQGEVLFEGSALSRLGGRARRRVQRDMQMIFQDPYGSIDPRWTVGDVIAEPLVSHLALGRTALRARVEELLDLVGLDASARTRYAHEFSGGQRQRIGIARAIALEPKFIVADEPVSALDLSVQAQVINLLADLRARLGLTTLFIGHGLHAVRHLSDRVGVMYLGRLVEVGEADDLFAAPLHPYSQLLIRSIPASDPRRRLPLVQANGELPSPTAPPAGCHFHPRCPAATARCREEVPVLREVTRDRQVACHHPGSI
ncbi:MAG: ABC transporter ATP-binding protein [Polyangiales bacterium]